MLAAICLRDEVPMHEASTTLNSKGALQPMIIAKLSKLQWFNKAKLDISTVSGKETPGAQEIQILMRDSPSETIAILGPNLVNLAFPNMSCPLDLRYGASSARVSYGFRWPLRLEDRNPIQRHGFDFDASYERPKPFDTEGTLKLQNLINRLRCYLFRVAGNSIINNSKNHSEIPDLLDRHSTWGSSVALRLQIYPCSQSLIAIQWRNTTKVQ